MLFLGITAGLLSAFVQSGSYVCSRFFMLKHGSSLLLAVYSQIVMGIIATLLLPICLYFVRFPINFEFTWLLSGGMGLMVLAQYSFFKTCHEMEASRLSSLLGLKIVVLSLLAMIILGESLNFVQYTAIFLCSIAAVGMNLTGGRITLRGAMWLAVTLMSYSLSDVFCQRLTYLADGEPKWMHGVTTAMVFYSVLGFCTLPALALVSRKWIYFKDAAPFGVTWLTSMTFLLVSFNLLSVVFAGILQASRGIVSVAMGAVLLYYGYTNLEPRVDRRAWIRRLLMALVMLTAMALYSYGRSLHN